MQQQLVKALLEAKAKADRRLPQPNGWPLQEACRANWTVGIDLLSRTTACGLHLASSYQCSAL